MEDYPPLLQIRQQGWCRIILRTALLHFFVWFRTSFADGFLENFLLHCLGFYGWICVLFDFPRKLLYCFSHYIMQYMYIIYVRTTQLHEQMQTYYTRIPFITRAVGVYEYSKCKHNKHCYFWKFHWPPTCLYSIQFSYSRIQIITPPPHHGYLNII